MQKKSALWSKNENLEKVSGEGIIFIDEDTLTEDELKVIDKENVYDGTAEE